MKNLNRWQGIGRLGRDPESKATQSGQTVINFSMACQDDYKDKAGEKIERTEWVRVVMWGQGAEIFAKYATKGSKVYIEGKLTTRKWQDKEGRDQYTTEVNASGFEFLDSKSDGQSSAPSARPQQAKTYTNEQGQPSVDYEDDIPF
jgi:single-strand DNA-binding protein